MGFSFVCLAFIFISSIRFHLIVFLVIIFQFILNSNLVSEWCWASWHHALVCMGTFSNCHLKISHSKRFVSHRLKFYIAFSSIISFQNIWIWILKLLTSYAIIILVIQICASIIHQTVALRLLDSSGVCGAHQHAMPSHRHLYCKNSSNYIQFV